VLRTQDYFRRFDTSHQAYEIKVVDIEIIDLALDDDDDPASGAGELPSNPLTWIRHILKDWKTIAIGVCSSASVASDHD
jgi:hypothetical protein